MFITITFLATTIVQFVYQLSHECDNLHTVFDGWPWSSYSEQPVYWKPHETKHCYANSGCDADFTRCYALFKVACHIPGQPPAAVTQLCQLQVSIILFTNTYVASPSLNLYAYRCIAFDRVVRRPSALVCDVTILY